MPFHLLNSVSGHTPDARSARPFWRACLDQSLRSLADLRPRTHVRLALLPAALAALTISAPAGAQNLQESGLDLPGVWAGEGAWGDFDQDGDLDLALIGEIETIDGRCERITRILRNDNGLLVEDVAISDRLRGVYFGDVGWADYDSDGDLDLAVAGWDEFGQESARLYENDGETPDRLLTLTSGLGEQPELKGVRYADLSWADMDNDGDPDLVITGMEANGTSLTRLYRNTDGVLLHDEVNSEALINAHNGDLAWGDVDNDGDLDLALSGENVIPEGGLGNVTEFYLNDPPGTLSLASNIALIDNNSGRPLAIRRGSLAWSDYDEDGNIDLAISGRDPGFNTVLRLYRNRPAGTLSQDTEFSLSSSQIVDGSLDWVDYDNDGDPDLAVTGRTVLSAHRALVFDNREGSVSGVSVENSLVGLFGGTALWADYSGNGRVDLLITGVDETGTRRSLLYDNLGTPDANRAPDPPRSLNAPKVTGSRVLFSWTPGDDDKSNSLTYNIRIGTEEGLGDILSSSVAVGPGNTGFKTDFLLERLLTAKPRYFWNVQSVDGAFARSDFLSSDGVFAIEQFVSSEQRLRDLKETSMTWGDVDDDGDLDLAIMGTNRGGEVQSLVYVNDEGILLLDEDAGIDPVRFGDLGWGDFDNDGDLDLAITGEDVFGNRSSRIYRTTAFGGELSFALSAQFPALSRGSVDWGDADNDGDLDILLMGQSDEVGGGIQLSKTQFWLNDGNGASFTLAQGGLIGLNNGEARWGDTDGDGDLDVALCGVDSDEQRQFRLYGNTGDGSMVDAELGLTGLDGCDLAWGDLDRDGALDLAAAGDSEAGVITIVLRNDGDGGFEDLPVELPGIRAGDLAWGDFDNDQDLDLVITGSGISGAPVLEVHRNTIGQIDPASPFELRPIGVLEAIDFSSAALVDIDGDGDLDLISAGRNAGFAPTSVVNDNLAGQANPNLPPDPPGLLANSDSGATLLLTWQPGTDNDEDAPPVEGFTYNLRVGTTPVGGEVVSGVSRLGPGNTGHQLSRRLRNLASRTYFWSVQTVDIGFAHSAWTAPQEVVIDTIRPVVAAFTINTQQVGIGQTVSLALEFTDEHSGIAASDSVAPVVQAVIGGQTLDFQQLQFTGRSWSGELTITPATPSGTASISVTGLRDGKGNPLVRFDSTDAFVVDSVLPGVVTSDPVAGQEDVSPSRVQLSITFSEPIDPASIGPESFLISVGATSLSLAAVPSYDPATNTVVLIPEGGFFPGTRYTIEVSAAIQDLAGNRPENAISIGFATAIPQLVTTVPPDGSSAVAVADDRISATFDTPLLTAALAGADAVQILREGVRLELEGDGAVFDGETNTLSFGIAEGLEPGTLYEVILTGILAGPLRAVNEGDFSWRFSTAVPELRSVSPDSGASGISLDDLDEAVLTFSVPIDDDQLVAANFLLLREGEPLALRSGDPQTHASGVYGLAPADGWQVGSSYTVQVSATVTGPLGASQPISWQFLTAVPAIQDLTPAADATDVSVLETTMRVVFDNAIDEAALLVPGSARLLREGREISIGEPGYNPETRTATFAPTEGLRAGTSYLATISSAVAGPQGSTDFSWRFSTTVPKLRTVSPDSGAVGVSLDDLDEAVVTFSVPIDDDQLVAANFLLLREGEAVTLRNGDPQTRDASVGRYGLAPADGWQVGSSYTVQISPVVTGPLGESQSISWQFQTAVPAILSLNPTAGDTHVSVLESTLRAVFDHALDEVALRAAGSVRLFREGREIPIDEPVYNSATRAIGFAPIEGLRAGTPYRVVIAAAVAGPRATADFQWEFTTQVPAIASTDPADGGIIPAGLRRLVVVFTSPVDDALVNSRNFIVTKGGEQLFLADGEFLYEGLTVSLPPIDFEPGSAYEAVIRPQLLGSRAADRPPPPPWRFTTSIPAVIATEPGAGAEGVSLATATIEITFSGRIASRDATGFQLASRSLGDVGQNDGDRPFEEVQITGFGTNAALSIVNFAPVGGFRPFTEYRVSVDREVMGELADADSSWVFSTAARIADARQGETVRNPQRTLTLFFPPNSLQGGNGEVSIRVANIGDASLPGGKALSQNGSTQDGSVSMVGQAYEIDIGDAFLRKPVTLTLSYSEADLGGRNPTRLGVFTVSGSDILRRVGGTADPAAKTVRTTVEELGIFALFEDLSVGLGSASIEDVDCQPRAFSPLGGALSSETDISFGLTGPADVTVRVYNTSGRLERVIARDTPMAPGRNSLAWDGRDEDEDIVASGLYIVVVSAGDERAEKVVAVVR